MKHKKKKLRRIGKKKAYERKKGKKVTRRAKVTKKRSKNKKFAPLRRSRCFLKTFIKI